MRLILTLLTALTAIAASAQDFPLTVKGKVTDSSDGSPIPFASVHIEGTMVGINADGDGFYTISIPEDCTLIFSSIGFRAKEVSTKGRTTLDVSLDPDAEIIEETIVIAYGTATKSSFTGSAAVVDAQTIESRVSTDVTRALAGTTPGVQVISSSGDPADGGATIRIRGIGSMSASNSPLYIVDGMPFDGSISDINPNDVESMSVLKDAAASAIYGARGANGVVLITTKRSTGSSDARIRFDAKWGSNSRLIPQYDVIDDPAQYYETHYRMMYNSQVYAGKSPAEAYAYADANLFNQNNGGLGYQVFTIPAGEKFIGTDFRLNPKAVLGYSDGEYYYTPDNWYSEAFHSSFRQEYNLSVSGGRDRLNYYGSVGYLNDGGIVNNSDYERYTARINVDWQAREWMKVSTSMSYAHSDSQSASYSSTYGSSGNIFYITNMMGPIYPLYVRDADGHIMYENGMKLYDSNQTNFVRPSFVGNAVRDNEVNRRQNYSDFVTGKWGVVITPISGLSITANIGLTDENSRYNALYSRFGSQSSTDGQAYVSHDRAFAVNNQYLAEYKTDFQGSVHSLNILAGYELYRLKEQFLEGQNDHLFDPYIGELSNADGSNSKQLSSYTADYLTQGFLTRAQYEYAGRYFASASYRRDGSSRFAPGHRWGNFGSIGAAWLTSSEWFMEDIWWLDMLKLKASYGVQGNDNLYPSSNYTRKYHPYSDNYTHSYNEATGEYSTELAYKGNEELTWESSHAFNIGVDFEVLSGLLNGSMEYFSRKTVDLLYSKDVPLSSGNPTGYYPVNVGSIANNGFEFSFDGIIMNRTDLLWTWNLNMSHYNNRIVSLDPSISEKGIMGGNYIYKVGGSLYEAYMRKFAGVDPENGKARWYRKVLDQNGDWTGESEITEVFSDASQYELGSVLPELYGGFGTALKAYGFDFSAQFSFQLGGKYYDGTYQALMHTSSSAGTAWHKDALRAWTEDNPSSEFPRLDGDTSVGQTAVSNYLTRSDYLSINNITLGYTLPEHITALMQMESLRIYLAGDNLAVISARRGMDPRFSMGLGSLTSGSGLNSGSYSAMRTITAGVTLTF
ncbi:MAG: SusC/RagA family TonB-linked outer membrane protein [Bacteroidales bacterium]|nr:SusC/RagA family TonB-linked outer membrane protein [Bacteroidales bacterium]